MKKPRTRSPFASALLGLLVVALALIVGADGSAAGPQQCVDPYGCPAPAPDDGFPPASSCSVSPPQAAVDERVTVDVTNVPVGRTLELRLNGAVVDTRTAQPDSAGAATGFVTVSFSFLVPQLADGRYTLVAVGPAFQTTCLADAGGFEVLGTDLGSTPTTDGVLGNTIDQGGGTPRGSSLARTGLAVAALLVLAVLLVIAGQAVLDLSRRRRVRAQRRLVREDRESTGSAH